VLQGQHRVVAGDAEVVGVAHGDHADVVVAGLGDGPTHGDVAGDLAHAVIAVDQCGGSALALDRRRRGGVEHARVDQPHVLRQAGYAMALDATRVAGHQYRGRDAGTLRGHARPAQDRGRVIPQRPLVDARVLVTHGSLASLCSLSASRPPHLGAVVLYRPPVPIDAALTV